jgi:DNA mismatch repair protein MutS
VPDCCCSLPKRFNTCPPLFPKRQFQDDHSPIMSKPKTTPMLQQYLAIKAQYKDAILFYRMGDFYEMFFEDAQVASRVLEITLTSRNKNDSAPVPMCGFPFRAAQSYLARLIDNGYKVAICDQVENPAEANGLVKREVVRVVTPGMIVENELLEAKNNNYLLALTADAYGMGIACMDISTGTFRVAETGDHRKIAQEVQRIGPREVLLPAGLRDDPLMARIEKVLPHKTINWLADSAFDPQAGRRQLLEQFQTLTLEGFGCQKMTTGLGAAGALLFYIHETQKQSLAHFQRITTYNLDDHLIVDHMSRQNLELEHNIRNSSRRGTLIHIIDKTVTAMGGRRLKHWLRYPLLSVPEIGQRLDAVDELLVKIDIRQALGEALDSVYDLERLNSKIVMGHANARDLVALKRSLLTLPTIWEALNGLHGELFQCPDHLDELTRLAQHMDRAIREDAPPSIHEGGLIKQGYNPELDELVRISRDGKGYLAQLEVREKERTGIASLKVRFNKVFSYYIEVPKTQIHSVPDHYVRKQTLVNAERYITEELKQFETKVLGAEDQRWVLELALFNQIRQEVSLSSSAIQAVADFLARMDCLLSLAVVAEQNDYCRPRINTLGEIHITEGRHPVVEKMISAERFVPNTIHLDNDTQQLLIITGPNMAGKSTVLRQVALMVIMAQMGSFVPAADANISIIDQIFTRVGALDNLSSGQSTFMVEMEETANILNNATSRSLVVMDEIGRGTSTYDGLSIAWAVAEYLHDLQSKGVKTLFATHYHELTKLAQSKPRVQNFNIAVKEWNDQIIFLRKLIPGGTNRSYGIQVARLAGVPQDVVSRAKVILARIEDSAPQGPGLGSVGAPRAPGGAPPVQLDLFRSNESDVIQRLKRVDVNATTPLESLELLLMLQKKLNG